MTNYCAKLTQQVHAAYGGGQKPGATRELQTREAAEEDAQETPYQQRGGSTGSYGSVEPGK